MVTNLRSAGGIAAIWLAVVAGVSATAWFAIDRAGQDLTETSVSTLPPAALTTATPGSQPSATATSPRTSPSPTPTRHSTPTQAPATQANATPRDRTISVSGGMVSARCTGATIGLRAAQPENDWRVTIDTAKAGQIAVSFVKGHEGEHKTQVTAVCANGTPTFTVTNGPHQ